MIDSNDTLHFLDYWRVLRTRKEIVIAVSLLVVLTGIAVTFTLPKVYMASTKITIREEYPDVDVFSQKIARFDPLFLRTQFEIIQSRTVLEEVIRKLNLDEKIGKTYGYFQSPNVLDRTYQHLKKNMKVQQYRDTKLIEIQIYLKESLESAPELAADIANKIAEVFKNQRIQVSRDETEKALAVVFNSLEEQRKKVSQIERKVEEIRQKYKINVVSSITGTESALGKKSMTLLEAERIQTRMELVDKEARYNKIQSLPQAELLDAAPYVVGDPALASLVNQKRNMEVELSRLKEAYGPKHPDVVRADMAINEINKKIDDALNGLKTGVQAAYEAAKQKFDILEAELDSMKTDERTAEAGIYHEFDEAVEELAQARNIRDTLIKRYAEESIQQRMPHTSIEVIDEAKPPALDDNVSPNILLNIILSIILGLSSGIGLAFFVEYLDTSVKTIEEVERYMGVPILGVIPQKVKPLISDDAQPSHAEAYRVLRTNIQFSKKFTGGKTLCFTSGSMAEGKSMTLFNLAYVCAKLGDNVLIVDSDLHRPKQHKLLTVSNQCGLANVLLGEVQVEDAVIPTNVSNLYLMPSGKISTETHGLLDTRKMKELINILKENYSYVFFDAPPIIGISDTTLLAKEMDGVVLVIQHRKYPRGVSLRAKDILNNIGANLIGVVLNNINISRDYSYYYYHYASYYPPSSGSKSRREHKKT